MAARRCVPPALTVASYPQPGERGNLSWIKKFQRSQGDGISWRGNGHFDMGAYDSYFSGKLQDFAYPEEDIKAALARLPKVGM